MSIKEKIKNYIEENCDMEEMLENALYILMKEEGLQERIETKLASTIARDWDDVLDDYIEAAINDIVYDLF